MRKFRGQKYGGLMPSEMKRLKLLEEAGGGPLTRQGDVAGCRKKKALKPARARQLVEYLRTSYRISIRHACGALRFDRSIYHYTHRRPEQASLRKRIRELPEARVRYGYRHIHVLLRREGWTSNHKRTRRLYREGGLQLRRKTPKRKVLAKRREDHAVATAANDCWSMDFLSDQLFDGRKIRVLSIVGNAGDRCSAELSRRRCGGDPRTDCLHLWPAEAYPARQRAGVHLRRNPLCQ